MLLYTNFSSKTTKDYFLATTLHLNPSCRPFAMRIQVTCHYYIRESDVSKVAVTCHDWSPLLMYFPPTTSAVASLT